MYEMVRGPLLWIALGIFAAGSLYRLRSLRAKGDLAAMLVPFSREDFRTHPVMTLVSFAFTFCLLFTPLFIMGHAVSWHETWGIRWWSMPEGVAALATLAVIVGLVFFSLQWVAVPEVRKVTRWGDWLAMVLVMAPFLSGFLAYYQVFSYKTMLIIHIVSGALWLVALPFTSLFRLVWFGFGRAYLRSDFGAGN